jgi:hypothetical protein
MGESPDKERISRWFSRATTFRGFLTGGDPWFRLIPKIDRDHTRWHVAFLFDIMEYRETTFGNEAKIASLILTRKRGPIKILVRTLQKHAIMKSQNL